MRVDPHTSFFPVIVIFYFHQLPYLFTNYLLTHGLARFCSPAPFVVGHQLRSDLSGRPRQKRHHQLTAALTQTFTGETMAGGGANYLRFIAKQQAEISHRLFPCFPH